MIAAEPGGITQPQGATPASGRASPPVLAGVFLVAAAGLGLELILTRLMSVTQFHHYAFLAVSLGMLGVGAGGVVVHAFPVLADGPRSQAYLGWAAAGVAAFGMPAFVLQQDLSFGAGVPQVMLKTLALGLPFFFVGLVMAIALRRHSRDAPRVYGADLLGAAAGCLASMGALESLGGARALVAMSALGPVAGLCFIAADRRPSQRAWRSLALALSALAIALVAGEAVEIRPPNRRAEVKPLTERWNAFSRVAVYAIADPEAELHETVGMAYKGAYPEARFIQIDSSAGSHILDFSQREPAALAYLLHDIASAGFHLHDRAGKVLVIGAGGGRDVLTAALSGRRDITGIEVNPLMARILEQEFAGFSGRWWQLPGVRVVNDEARTYLARDTSKYAFIHASLACTWAATAAGAFVLTENALYTREAFRAYLERLEPGGILSMTMWYRGRPGELLRLASLARDALARDAQARAADHVAVLVTAGKPGRGGLQQGFGTFLLKKTPFESAELTRLRQFADAEGFRVLFAPGQPNDATLSALLEGDAGAAIRAFPLDISPPTDDRPFFFHQLRPVDYVQTALFGQPASGIDPLHRSVASLLTTLLWSTAGWAALLLVLPAARGPQGRAVADGASRIALAGFACLGLAFMLIEIPLIQQLSMYLGKPELAFSVVMSGLLVSAACGSLLTLRIVAGGRRAVHGGFFLLVMLLLGIALALPPLLAATMHWSDAGRVSLALACLAPTGLLMGIPLPLLVSSLGAKGAGVVPLGWAINGASSVLASVLAVLIAMNWGMQSAWFAGIACYALAWPLVARVPARARA